MSNHHRAGRPAKPPELHVFHGTRSKASSGHGNTDLAGGKPKKPDGLSDDAAGIWNLLVKQLGAIPKAIDAPAMEMICNAWSLYQGAVKLAKEDPVDKAARSAVSTYQSMFDKLAARFGLTPADRQRLRQEKPEVETQSKARFIK
jgi:phage terminase small subunit